MTPTPYPPPDPTTVGLVQFGAVNDASSAQVWLAMCAILVIVFVIDRIVQGWE